MSTHTCACACRLTFMFVTEMFTHECTWGIHSGVGRDKTCHLQSLLVAVDASMASDVGVRHVSGIVDLLATRRSVELADVVHHIHPAKSGLW